MKTNHFKHVLKLPFRLESAHFPHALTPLISFFPCWIPHLPIHSFSKCLPGSWGLRSLLETQKFQTVARTSSCCLASSPQFYLLRANQNPFYKNTFLIHPFHQNTFTPLFLCAYDRLNFFVYGAAGISHTFLSFTRLCLF